MCVREFFFIAFYFFGIVRKELAQATVYMDL